MTDTPDYSDIETWRGVKTVRLESGEEVPLDEDEGWRLERMIRRAIADEIERDLLIPVRELADKLTQTPGHTRDYKTVYKRGEAKAYSNVIKTVRHNPRDDIHTAHTYVPLDDENDEGKVT